MSLARHSPFRGHVAFFGQLHFLESLFSISSSFLLFPSITAFMFGIQLYESFTVFLLKILYSLLLGGEAFGDDSQKFLSNVGFHTQIVRWIEPDYIPFPRSFYCFGLRIFVM